MAPKDIRSFFGGAPKAADPASTPAPTSGVKRKATAGEGGQAATKKTKVEKAKIVYTPKSTTEAAKSSPSSPKAKAKAKPVAKAKPPVKAAPTGKAGSKARAAKGQKAKKLDDSDDDFEADSASDDDDADFEEAGVVEVDSDSDETPVTKKRGRAAAVLDDDSGSDLEVVPAPRSRPPPKSKPKPTSTPTRSLPSSLAAGTGVKKVKAVKAPTAALDASAEKAIAAVKAVIKKLPATEDVKYTVMKAAEGGNAGWGGGNSDAAPPNHGSKEAPIGHSDALTGLTFVISGVLDSMYRGEADSYIKRHGGRVTGSISGKTTFLLCGESTGASKYNASIVKKVPLIDEDGLLSLVEASIPFKQAEAPVAVTPAATSAPAGVASTSKSKAVPAPALAKKAGVQAETQLWVDKWKPKNARELVGNPGHLATMRQWLRDWDSVHNKGMKPGTAPGAAGKKDMSKKALLIGGPPGIGKTTAAHIIVTELGFCPVEVNASDTRNKSDTKLKNGIANKMSNRIKELVTNTSIGVGDGNTHTRHQVVIMDEVDGMSGGDRGGVSDLIQSIKVSKIPIICICNDKYKQSMKSLKNHCLELDWRKPMKTQVSGRLHAICQAEGLQLNQATMDALVETSQGDMRAILGQLQMYRLKAASLSYDTVKAASSKDADMSPFECARLLLSNESSMVPMGDRFDYVFQDADLVPLLIQENYLNHKPAIAPDELTALSIYSKAAEAMSLGDVVNKRVRINQEWNLMPMAVLMSGVYPTGYVRGQRDVFGLYPGEMNFPRFTAWLGCNSSANKQKRICGELTTKLLAAGANADRRDLRLQYLPVLRLALSQPLVEKEAEGIPEVIDLMQNYLVSREDFDGIQEVTRFKTASAWGSDPMKGVPTKVKSAFTRSFNQQGLPIKCTSMVEDFKKGKKGKKSAPPALAEDDMAMGGEIAEANALMKDDEEVDDESDDEERTKRLSGVNFKAKETRRSKAAARKPGAIKKAPAKKPAAKKAAGRA